MKKKKNPGVSTWFFVFSFVRLHNFGWSPVYDGKAYLETNIVQNCSYVGFGGFFLVAGTIFWSLTSRIKRIKQMQRANHG